jgi:prepilin-type N-terminal cleavage/methylation domain-containing protein
MREAAVDAKRRQQTRWPAGFTLIELMIVITIIGIIVAFIMVASYEGVRRAETRATQALIAKLETGLTDRMEALLSGHINPNLAHQFLASTYAVGSPPPSPFPPPTGFTLTGGLVSPGRAQVMARFDLVKMQMPDVFFVQTIPASATANVYPLNFAAQPYPGTAIPASGNLPSFANFILPLGNSVVWDPTIPSYGGVALASIPADFKPAGDGIFGAAYEVAGGIYKNLGNVPPDQLPSGQTPLAYLPSGYDGTDNDQDGLIDEWDEGVNATNFTSVTQALKNHTHKTARSEMLYALLVEGRGNLGSVFSRDDFTSKEVQDTDGDGLPEFVDAWGEPLQFYRWPIHYSSTPPGQGVDLQKGLAPYNSMTEPRQQDPLDPNNLLVAPAWWSTVNAGAPGDPFANFPPFGPQGNQIGIHAFAFMNYFHSVVDFNAYVASGGKPPQSPAPTPPAAPFWDRGNFFARQSYFSKPLVISSGPDKKLGVAQLGFDYTSYDDLNFPAGTLAPVVGANNNPQYLLLIENTASSLTPFRDTGSPPHFPDKTDPLNAGLTNSLRNDWGLDDISNQTLQSAGGGIIR